MPLYTFRLTAVFQTFENDTHIAEALFFPDVSRFGANLEKLEAALKDNASQLSEATSALALYRRHYTGEAEIGEAKVIINPPPKSLAWRQPVELTFAVVRFPQGEDALIAYIPALGIEITGKDLEELNEQIPLQIHAHLLRLKKSTSLGKLMWLERAQKLTLVNTPFEAKIRAPKQAVMSLYAESEDKRSIMQEVATDLTKEKLSPAYEIEATVRRLADALAGRRPRSILLVGKSGVGKTAAFHELVRSSAIKKPCRLA